MSIPAADDMKLIRTDHALAVALGRHHPATCTACAIDRGDDVDHLLAVTRLDTEGQVAALYEARDEGDAAILALAKATIREVQEAIDAMQVEAAKDADRSSR